MAQRLCLQADKEAQRVKDLEGKVSPNELKHAEALRIQQEKEAEERKLAKQAQEVRGLLCLYTFIPFFKMCLFTRLFTSCTSVFI